MNGTPFGRYVLVGKLGEGGMGEVWRAHDTEIDRMVALKTLLPRFSEDPKFEQRFRREARAAARLDDPHVVPIYDVGQINGRLYVSMRLIQGQDLQTLLEDGPLEPQRAVAVIGQIAKALSAAHKVGLVHRDIKPSNILVTDDDFAYLIDFGIAQVAGETGLTSTGTTIGTWAYMAPERFSTGIAEPSSDIYALACVLFQCLTGRVPFPVVALEQIAVAHLTTPPPHPSAVRSTVPAAMDQVITAGMDKDPKQRFATAAELASAAAAAVALPAGHKHDPTSHEPTVAGNPRNSGQPTPSEVARAGAPTKAASFASGSQTEHAPAPLAPSMPPQALGNTPTKERTQSRTGTYMLVFVGFIVALAVVFVAVVVSYNVTHTNTSTLPSSSTYSSAAPSPSATFPASTASVTPSALPSSGTSAPNAGIDVLTAALSKGYSSSNCSVQPVSEVKEAFPTVLAVLLCGQNADGSGPAGGKYFLFPSVPDTAASFTKLITSDQLTNCGDAKSPTTWHQGNSTASAGQVACGTDSGKAEVMWTTDAKMILAFIRAPNGDTAALYQWWRTNG